MMMSRGSLPMVMSVLLRLGCGLGLGCDGLGRSTLGGACEERLEGVRGEHHVVVHENVVRVELVNGEQVDPRCVAQRLPSELVVTSEHHEGRAAVGDACQGGKSGLGRRDVALDEALDHVDAACTSPVRQSATKSGSLHLLRGALRVVARLRTVNDATTSELGRTSRTLTSAAGALLLVRL